MQHLTIQVPDNKIAFFVELVHNLGFMVDNKQLYQLTDEQVREVNEERRKIKENPEHFSDWDEARKSIKFD